MRIAVFRCIGIFLIIFSLSACSLFSSKKEEPTEEQDILAMESDELGEADEVASNPEEAQSELDQLESEDPFSDLNLAEAEAADTTVDSNEPETTFADSGFEDNASGEMANYTVVNGDTLMKIAFNIYGDVTRWKELRDLNKEAIRNYSSLVAGTSIKYYPASTPFFRNKLSNSYMIEKGDTLGGIAKNIYGKVVKYRKLQRYNPNLIRDPNVIYAGFMLYYEITEKEKQEAENFRNAVSQRSESIPVVEESSNVNVRTEPVPEPSLEELAVDTMQPPNMDLPELGSDIPSPEPIRARNKPVANRTPASQPRTQ